MIKKNLAIGIDIGGTNIKGGIVDKKGQLIASHKVPTEAEKGYEHVVNNIIVLINKMIEGNKKYAGKIAGIGIGCAGLIDAEKGIVHESPNLPGFINVPLAKDINKITGFPVIIDNDANVVALGEYCCGSGKGSDSLICLTVGTGVGGGIILNNKIWRGFTGSAGEAGHIIIKKGGRKCNCGSLGCLEQYASATAMVNEAKKAIKKTKNTILDAEKLSAYNIVKAARKNDALAIKIINESAEYFATGIASMVNLINPETVVIGGGVAQAGKIYLDPIMKKVKEIAFKSSTDKLKILKTSLGDKAGIIGAGFLLLENS